MKTASSLLAEAAAWTSNVWVAEAADAMPFVGIAAMWIALIIAVVIAMSIFTSRRHEGKRGGRRTRKIAAALLDAKTYHQMHDLILETKDGTVQIDHVIVSPFGVFVIETMDMGGTIFGKTFDPDWTQTFKGETTKFPNPLKPNYDRKLALNGVLGIGADKLFSIIAFTGNSAFEIAMPDNVAQGKDFVNYIRSKDAVLIEESEVPRIVAKIQSSLSKHPPRADRRAVQAGKPVRSVLRFMNLLKLAVIALVITSGSHILHNTMQYPVIPVDLNPIAWITGKTPPEKIEITKKETGKSDKVPRSQAYGFLTLTARKDTRLILIDSQSGKNVVSLELKKGESREIELKKGYYKAEILQNGKLRTRLVSFIGSTGSLEF
ncbi:MAG: nuclease-related domain-containing protein [Desulfomicrobium sp.]|nr:nuclease-related domain-containing protein [Desulfomicrobium sp.]